MLAAGSCVTWLLEHEIAHNVLISRGKPSGALSIFILPRRKNNGKAVGSAAYRGVTAGFPEASGQVFVNDPSDFDVATAEELLDHWRENLAVSRADWALAEQGCVPGIGEFGWDQALRGDEDDYADNDDLDEDETRQYGDPGDDGDGGDGDAML